MKRKESFIMQNSVTMYGEEGRNSHQSTGILDWLFGGSNGGGGNAGNGYDQGNSTYYHSGYEHIDDNKQQSGWGTVFGNV